jgi:sulfur-carrier protein
MGVLVRIPQPLQKLTQGKAEIDSQGATARELIENLEVSYAGIRERLLDDSGKLRRFVNVYLNDEDIRFLDDLDTTVADGDTISIVPAIAGGIAPGDPANQKKNSI